MSGEKIDVVVFSDDVDTRNTVINGVGLKADRGLPPIEWHEAATSWGAVEAVKEYHPAVIVLDAESPKIGGMAVARQLSAELDNTSPIVLLTARPQDDWLGIWSGASVIVSAPYDPRDLQDALARAIRLSA